MIDSKSLHVQLSRSIRWYDWKREYSIFFGKIIMIDQCQDLGDNWIDKKQNMMCKMR